MKRLVLFAALLACWAAPALAQISAPTSVTASGAHNTGGTSTAVSVTTNASVPASQALIIFPVGHSGNNLSAAADSSSNCGGYTTTNIVSAREDFSYCATAAGLASTGTLTATISGGGASWGTLAFYVTGAATTNAGAAGPHAGVSQAAVIALNSCTVTASMAVANTLVITAVGTCTATQTFAAGTTVQGAGITAGTTVATSCTLSGGAGTCTLTGDAGTPTSETVTMGAGLALSGATVGDMVIGCIYLASWATADTYGEGAGFTSITPNTSANAGLMYRCAYETAASTTPNWNPTFTNRTAYAALMAFHVAGAGATIHLLGLMGVGN